MKDKCGNPIEGIRITNEDIVDYYRKNPTPVILSPESVKKHLGLDVSATHEDVRQKLQETHGCKLQIGETRSSSEGYQDNEKLTAYQQRQESYEAMKKALSRFP